MFRKIYNICILEGLVGRCGYLVGGYIGLEELLHHSRIDLLFLGLWDLLFSLLNFIFLFVALFDLLGFSRYLRRVILFLLIKLLLF